MGMAPSTGCFQKTGVSTGGLGAKNKGPTIAVFFWFKGCRRARRLLGHGSGGSISQNHACADKSNCGKGGKCHKVPAGPPAVAAGPEGLGRANTFHN